MADQIHLTVGPGEEDNKEFGQFAQELRDAAHLSRAAAANSVGVTSEYLRLIERGQRTPALGTMHHLLHAYQVSNHQISRNELSVGRYVIKFVSRIQEERYANVAPLESNRYEKIGQIVSLLTTADEETLKYIHNKLLKTRS